MSKRTPEQDNYENAKVELRRARHQKHVLKVSIVLLNLLQEFNEAHTSKKSIDTVLASIPKKAEHLVSYLRENL